jgi:protein-S-isoprenylcysteine O-methyltransferase Ste14
MSRLLITFYGILCYCLFILVFVYIEAFLLEIIVPKSINSGTMPTSNSRAIMSNLLLVFIFGFFHSLMSRKQFKEKWTRIIPVAAERSTYVLQASLFLVLLMWQWQPMPTLLWSFTGIASWFFYTCFALGNIIVLWSIFLIDHFELFGLRQVWCNQRGKPMPQAVFKTPALYKVVRHPMQLGTLIILWATPSMSVGHFLFASSMTLYVFIGLKFEERSLQREFGEAYLRYQQQVPLLIPRFKRM